jgi:CysZ protein
MVGPRAPLAPSPRKGPRLGPADFFRGTAYALRGLRILRKYPELARYWVVPILLTALALTGSFVVATRYHDDLLSLLWRSPAGSDLLAGVLRGVYWLVRAFFFLVTLGGLLLLSVLLSGLFAAPFNDALSEAIEEREGGLRSPPFSLARLGRDLLRSVRLELLKLVVFAAIMTPLTIFSWLVPGIGHLAAAGIGGLFTVVYFAMDYIDWPASRRGLGIRARLSLFSRRPWLMLGFGVAVWGCLFVPILNIAFMPIAVAGGTRLFLDLESELQG